MARIFVTTTAVKTRWNPYALSNFNRIVQSANANLLRTHTFAMTAEEADFVLFVGSRCKFHQDVMTSEEFKRHHHKSFLFDFEDNALPLLPGIYMGIPKHLAACSAYEYGFYVRVFDNGVISENSSFSEVKHLFSFIGRVSNCPNVRTKVIGLLDERSVVSDSWSGESDKDADYARLLTESKFVICPRGYGPSTWRVFETMRAGRCPVIISDEWRPPRGPIWDECSVRVPESEVHSIPALLRSIEDCAEQMGHRAYEEWQRHFSLTTAFTWIGNTLQTIDNQRNQWLAASTRWRVLEAIRDKRLRWAFLTEFLKEFVLRHAP